MDRQRVPVRLAFFMIAYYATNCMYQSYMSLYYTSVPFNAAQIGVINAVVALASIAAQPVWGTLGDRTRSRRRLIAILAAASAGLAALFGGVRAFVPMLLLAAAFSCFYTSVQPMGDSVILGELNCRDLPFGPFRLAGGMSFAIAGVIFGRVLNAPGQAARIPLYVAMMCLLTALSCLALPAVAGGQSASGRKMRFSELFRYREMMGLLLFIAPIQMTMGYFYTFFSPHFMTLEGGDSAGLGLCYFLSACSEVPFLLLSDRLFDRYGALPLMRFSALTLCARWLILGFSGNVVVVTLAQLLHGWGFIVMTVCMAKYVSRALPDELQASGQMLLAIVSFGVARAVGNLGGGLLADVLGYQRVFFVCAGICSATLGLSLLSRRARN